MAGRDEEKITTAEQVLKKEGKVMTPSEVLPGKVISKTESKKEKIEKGGSIIYIKADPKKKYAVKLEYLGDREFKLEVAVTNKKNVKDAKKVIKEALSTAYAYKLIDFIGEGEEFETPEVRVVVHAPNVEMKNDIKRYVSKLLSLPPKKLIKKPANWKKRLLYVLTAPFMFTAGFYVGTKITEAAYVPIKEELKSVKDELNNLKEVINEHAPAIAQALDNISSAASEALDYVNDLLGDEGIIAQIRSGLQNARDYVDSATEKLVGIKASAVSIKQIAEQQIQNLQNELERLANGYDYHWDNEDSIPPTRISADYDHDGQVDAWQDENGVWHYDEDSGNPAIPYHQSVQEGTTEHNYVNIANAFEQACKDYQAFQADIEQWELVKSLAEGIENDATVAMTQLASAKSEITNVVGSDDYEGTPLLDQLQSKVEEIKSKLETIKSNANAASQELSYILPQESAKVRTSSIGKIKNYAKAAYFKVKGYLDRHPRIKAAGIVGAVITVSYIFPPAYYIWWGYKIKAAVDLRKPWKEFHKKYKKLLEVEGPSGVVA